MDRMSVIAENARPALREQVAEFLYEEAELLDARRFLDWVALFDDDGWYWVPVDPAQTDPTQGLAHFYDDRQLLEVRALRLCRPDVIPQQPASATVRVVGNVRVRPETGGLRVVAAFHMAEHRVNRFEAQDDRRLHSGRATYLLRPADGGFRIRWKRVDLVDAAASLRAISFPL
jgi:benzoate/toluate 1,2-dioxygenase beta subunit